MEKHGKRIRIFRNGDPYFKGKKFLISPTYHRIFEQFLEECSKEFSFRVKNLYQFDGKRLHSLDDFDDGSCYICTNGEHMKKIQYNSSETGPEFNAYSKTNLNIPVVNDNPILERRCINASTGGLLGEMASGIQQSEKSLFDPTSKAFKIAVFENGEPNQDGLRLILNHRNCKTFDQLMKYFSSMKIIRCGQVRKMYDMSTGRRIRYLQDIYNGMNLVLSAFDPFKKVPYKAIDLSKTKTKVKRTPEVPRIVKFFPNGDAYHSGLTVTVTKRKHPTILKLLDQLNTQIELVTGKIRKIYGIDGIRIMKIEDLKSGGSYVLVANDDPVIRTTYNRLSLKRRNSLQKGLQGFTLQNQFVKNVRPVTTKQKEINMVSTEDSDKIVIATETNANTVPRTKTPSAKEPLKMSSHELSVTELVLEAPKPQPQATINHSPLRVKSASRSKTPLVADSEALFIEGGEAPISERILPNERAVKSAGKNKKYNDLVSEAEGIQEDISLIGRTGREEEELFSKEQEEVQNFNSKSIPSRNELKKQSNTPSRGNSPPVAAEKPFSRINIEEGSKTIASSNSSRNSISRIPKLISQSSLS